MQCQESTITTLSFVFLITCTARWYKPAQKLHFASLGSWIRNYAYYIVEIMLPKMKINCLIELAKFHILALSLPLSLFVFLLEEHTIYGYVVYFWNVSETQTNSLVELHDCLKYIDRKSTFDVSVALIYVWIFQIIINYCGEVLIQPLKIMKLFVRRWSSILLGCINIIRSSQLHMHLE